MRDAKFRGTVIKLVAFAVVSVVATTVVIATLLDLQTSSTRSYTAVFRDASGLQSGDTVAIAGVQVGRVNGVSLRHDLARVSFTVDSNQQLTTTTAAQVGFQNLIGNRFLMLTPGTKAGRPLPSGSTIPDSRTSAGLDLTALFNGFQPLFSALTPSDVNQLTASIIAIFQGQSGTISELLQQTATLTNNLADRGEVITSVIDNLTPLLNAVTAHDTQLGNLIDGFDSLVRGLAGDRGQISTAIVSVGHLTGRLSNLLAQSQPALDQDISGLSKAAHYLSGDQTQIDAVINHLTPFLTTLNKVSNSGNYLSVYVCNLTLETVGSLNVSLVPGVTAKLAVPTGQVGSSDDHTANCR